MQACACVKNAKIFLYKVNKQEQLEKKTEERSIGENPRRGLN